ncbi:hypothetical protein [Planktothrix paucivesiculata]|uniref:Uncharacterized protein n=1 Tax=Planktothrix paucivesiculata PCC 9631 TaxID=671071 RepID=A0A7Z9BV42_9CYAN|nr:hypothetical protein [Planktothrix paucivesiculata]VXD20155.1 conserved exported hypothetical protein [Planktothrix paucivesiculata PCC 9631]
MLKSSTVLRAGLGTGLFFTVCFLAVGDVVLTSVQLGIISGWCVGCLVKWWQIDQKPESTETFEIEAITDNLSDILTKSKLLPPPSKLNRRPTEATTILGWIFKRNKS